MVAAITFTQCGPKLDLTQIHALERQLGVKLPDDYRQFLVDHNGGRPSKRCFCIPGDSDIFWVDFFHSVDVHLAEPSRQTATTTIAFAHSVFGSMVPEDCLIIGTVAGDDLLLLRYRGKRAGEIALKIPLELGPPTIDNPNWSADADRELGVHRVAGSFSEFLEMLTDCD
jgi:hypothetical protein